jgi:hypothetical protein
MAPNKGATLSALVDPLSEDEFLRTDIDMMPTPDSQAENKGPTKRKPGRPKAALAGSTSKITKPKVASRRVSGVGMAKGKATTAGAKKGRKALEEKSSNPTDGNETEEVDSFDEAPPKKSGVVRGAKEAEVFKKRGKAAKASEVEVEAPKKKTAKTNKATEVAPKKAGRPKRVAAAMEDSEIPETQPDLMDIEPTETLEPDETVIPEPEPVRKPVSRQPVRSASRQPDILASRHRRAGSASDNERTSDPALRRKLGETTKKFENLELKYRSLKELGTTDSQSNFEKLRKSTEKRAKGW